MNEKAINDKMEREITCICCPLGCTLTVKVNKDNQVTVTGNTCKRGAQYGEKELLHPTRTVTTTVKIKDRKNQVLPVKTATEIPKDRIKDCMAALQNVEAVIPISVGDVILENVAGMGVNVIATRKIQS